MTVPLLKVDNLRISLAGDGATYNAVENVSFEIGRGEAFGLVGESGCGKSITALAVMGLLRRPLSLGGGRILLDGEEIQDASPAEMRRLRGKRIAMIFQEPMTALNPLSPVGKQIAEMFVLHQGASWNEAMDRAEESLRSLQTVILLDEPSSGIAQREVEALSPLLLRLRDEMGASLVVIEHDMEFVRRLGLAQRFYGFQIGHGFLLAARSGRSRPPASGQGPGQAPIRALAAARAASVSRATTLATCRWA